MNVHTYETALEASEHAANLFLNCHKTFTYGCTALPTGNTPRTFYQYLSEHKKRAWLQPYSKHYFNLDEYIGLSRTDKQSYYQFLREHFVFPCGIDPFHHYAPDGMTEDFKKESTRYEARIQSLGGLNISVVGLGRNGHLAFNEPGSSFDSKTRKIELNKVTRQANQKHFSSISEVPTHAISMGLNTIFNSEQIILLAFGGHKAEAVAKMLQGPISPECPASILRKHKKVDVFVDALAAQQLA